MPSTLYLLPNAAGDLTEINHQVPASGAHWDKCDDPAASPDEGTTYIYSSDYGLWKYDLYNLAAPNVAVGDINWIKAWIRCNSGRGPAGEAGYAKTSIKTGGTRYDSDVITLNTEYNEWISYSTQYITNPKTGVAWTWDDLIALQAGLGAYSWWIPLPIQYYMLVSCTQVFVEVNYSGALFGCVV